MKPATKNKQSTSFAELIADSELETKTIQVGDHSVVIREMTGRERFSLAEKADDPPWDTMLWVAHTGLVTPKPETPEDLEKIKTSWVAEIANAVLSLSGMDADADDTVENESASVTGIGGS